MGRRNTFHEDDLRHYSIKLENARADGHEIGYDNYRRASKVTLMELDLYKENAKMERFLDKLDPVVRERLKGLLR